MMDNIFNLFSNSGNVFNSDVVGVNIPELDSIYRHSEKSDLVSGSPNQPVMPAPWLSWSNDTSNDLSAMPEGSNALFRDDATPDPKTIDTTHDELQDLLNGRAPWQGQQPEGKSSDITPQGLDSLDEMASAPLGDKGYREGAAKASEKAEIVGSNSPDVIDAYLK